MALSAFTEKARPPREADLTTTLGRAATPWRAFVKRIEAACAPVEAEWGYTSAATGWSLRLKHGKRVLAYLTPREGCFLASFALGEKAVAAAQAAKLATATLAAIDAAPRYAEGRGVRVEVRTAAQAQQFARLVEIKHAH